MTEIVGRKEDRVEALEVRTGKLEKRQNWHTVTLCLIVVAITIFTLFSITACRVEIPEETEGTSVENRGWKWKETSPLPEGLEFTLNEEKGEVDVLWQGAVVKTMAVGDEYTLIQIRAQIALSFADGDYIVTMGEEEAGRFTRE